MRADVDGLRREQAFGERVRIRPFVWEDCEILTQWGKHEHPLYELYDRPSELNAWYLNFYEQGRMRTTMRFAVENYNNELIGYLTLFQIDARRKRCTLGANFEVNQTGKGLGSEAINLLLQLCWNHGFEAVLLEVVDFNNRAIKCYEKCGFELIRSLWDPNSERCDFDIFGDAQFSEVRDSFKIVRGRLCALKHIMSAKKPK